MGIELGGTNAPGLVEPSEWRVDGADGDRCVGGCVVCVVCIDGIIDGGCIGLIDCIVCIGCRGGDGGRSTTFVFVRASGGADASAMRGISLVFSNNPQLS